MRFSSLIFIVAAALPLAAVASPAPALADTTHFPTGRCNDRIASGLEGQAQGFQDGPPADSELADRFTRLGDLLTNLQREDEILVGQCTANEATTPRIGELRVSEARAYMLEGDVVSRQLAKSCPAGQKPVVAGFVAQAWRLIARSIPFGGSEPASAVKLSSDIQSRAKAVGLTLPTLADTSDYWVQTTQAAGLQAEKQCQE